MKLELTEERLFEAVAEGARRAIWQAITNATDMPCADTFATMEKAFKEAMAEHLERKTD